MATQPSENIGTIVPAAERGAIGEDTGEESQEMVASQASPDTPKRGNITDVSATPNPMRASDPTRTSLQSPCSEDSTPRFRRKGVRYARHSRKNKASKVSLRSVVQRVSQKAALSTKKAVWDSNQISVDAALRAVDQWEALYSFLRQCTIMSFHQAQTVYQATKLGASKMEQGILRPVRDWIVLPAFGGMEQAVMFVQSDQAHFVAHRFLDLVRRIPFLGQHVLCPWLLLTGGMMQRTWQVVQYPIPKKHQVRDTVDWALTSSKWALLTVGREFMFFFKRADANITRTLSHTQWKVLGSGPYATVDHATKHQILSHMTERYCSLHPLWSLSVFQRQKRQDTANEASQTTTTTASSGNRRVDHDCMLARYELAAHIKRHNPPLYRDLIRSGLLLKRGGRLFEDDEWLKQCPLYRHLERNNFLIPENDGALGLEETDEEICTIMPLWFRLPSLNGKPPPRDTAWICFPESDQHELEDRYRQFIQMSDSSDHQDHVSTLENPSENCDGVNSVGSRGGDDKDGGTPLSETPEMSVQNKREDPPRKYPTVAQWYSPDKNRDVFVDQKRHVVTFCFHCPACTRPLVGKGEEEAKDPSCTECSNCTSFPTIPEAVGHKPFVVPPPVTGVMRPTMWRFHGPGDLVRRSNWFLDTPRNGLQPFDEESQAVLEDAYLFLKWMAIKKEPSSFERKLLDINEKSFQEKGGDSLEGALLTVDVTCPDGKDRLVQFGSLTHATAIQKGLSASVSINKLRVYRGAWLPKRREEELAVQLQPKPVEIFIQESIDQAASEYGTLGDTQVPNTCLRDILKPPPRQEQTIDRVELLKTSQSSSDIVDDLAAPTARLFQEDMAKYLKDPKGGPVDHLCLIVHGIGEMMQSIDLFGLALPNLSTIVDCCGYLRRNHAEIQVTDFSQIYPYAASDDAVVAGRVEYLPIEWHEAFSILSQRRAAPVSPSDAENPEDHVMLKDISLPTIPNMREFANDTLMDVLYFMSPEHHDIITDIVADEMNVVVEKFQQVTGFSGRVSIIGHSLGSIISWDILANQQLPARRDSPEDTHDDGIVEAGPGCNGSLSSLMSDYRTATSESLASPELNIPPPSVSMQVPYSYPQLRFQVDNFFLMGSPVPVFLMIRNQRKPLTESYFLSGCRRVFNIFHPFDPVSYRIEPCIDPRNADFEPTIIKHWNGGFRVQYQTKRFWKKLVETTWETQRNFAEAFEASMAGMGLLDSTAGGVIADSGEHSEPEPNSDSAQNNYVVTGQLNGGRRIDYMLQEKEIEAANEYVAALAAHSCYWTEKDVSLFIARQISLGALELDQKEFSSDA